MHNLLKLVLKKVLILVFVEDGMIGDTDIYRVEC